MSFYEFSRVVNVNSLDRLSGSHSDFTFRVQKDENFSEYDSVCLLSASIPKSFYSVQSGFTRFQLDENGTTVNVNVAVGNYNVNTLITYLEAALSGLSPNSLTYTITFNEPQGTFNFQQSNGTIVSTFIFTNAMYEQLGFDENTSYIFSGNKLFGVNVINLSPEINLYVRSNIVSHSTESILSIISSAQIPTFGYINYICRDVVANSRPCELTSDIFTLQLTNDRSEASSSLQILNTNGVNMIFQILLYKSSTFETIVRDYFSYRVMKDDHKENKIKK
jgi:hypothetical protein